MGIDSRMSRMLGLCRGTWLWLVIWKTVPVFTWIRAAEAFKAEDFSKAVRYYRRGLSKCPSHPAHFSARYDLAYCLYRLGEIKESAQELSYIIATKHNMPEAYLLRARLLRAVGKYHSARKTLEQALKLFSDHPEVIAEYMSTSLFLGMDHARFDQLNQRLSFLILQNDSVKFDKRLCLSAQAQYLLRQGEEEKAEKIMIRLIVSGEACALTHILRGQQFLKAGSVIQAREQFRRANILHPFDPFSLLLLSKTFLVGSSQEDISQAIQLAESACRASKWENADAVEALVAAVEAGNDTLKLDLYKKQLESMSAIRYLRTSVLPDYFQQYSA